MATTAQLRRAIRFALPPSSLCGPVTGHCAVGNRGMYDRLNADIGEGSTTQLMPYLGRVSGAGRPCGRCCEHGRRAAACVRYGWRWAPSGLSRSRQFGRRRVGPEDENCSWVYAADEALVVLAGRLGLRLAHVKRRRALYIAAVRAGAWARAIARAWPGIRSGGCWWACRIAIDCGRRRSHWPSLTKPLPTSLPDRRPCWFLVLQRSVVTIQLRGTSGTRPRAGLAVVP